MITRHPPAITNAALVAAAAAYRAALVVLAITNAAVR